MSDWLELRVEHHQPTFDGLPTFGGNIDYRRPIETPPEQYPEIEAFVAKVNAAIERNGDNQ